MSQATWYTGDVLEVLPKLPDGSVDLVLTSPPFLALRSYLPADHPDKALEGGAQATPGAYIDWLVDVVEACDRVLAPHGSLCLELGDTYANRDGAPGGNGWPADKSLTLIPELFRFSLGYGFNPLTGRETQRWRLRNVIRWVRPNPPVGALGDKFRPATSELMVFCRTDEAGRRRYFDLDAVRAPTLDPEHNARYAKPGGAYASTKREGGLMERVDKGAGLFPNHPGGAPPLDWWKVPLFEGEEETRYGPDSPRATNGPGQPVGRGWKGGKFRDGDTVTDPNPSHGWQSQTLGFNNPVGAPPLDWWEIPPGGYSGAHYAVWPPELLLKPIKTMCPERVCRRCGEPSRRIVEQTPEYAAFRESKNGNKWQDTPNFATSWDQGDDSGARGLTHITLGFSDCGHNEYRRGIVLDPFAGSGTTLAVATGLGRDAIGIDLDGRNLDLARERVGMFLVEG